MIMPTRINVKYFEERRDLYTGHTGPTLVCGVGMYNDGTSCIALAEKTGCEAGKLWNGTSCIALAEKTGCDLPHSSSKKKMK